MAPHTVRSAPVHAATAPAPEPDYAVAAWRALGTYVRLVVADAALLPAAQAEAVRLLQAVDLACSRFRDDSDLVAANRGAGHWVPVSPLLAVAVQVALQAAEDTGGLVDPTLGLSLEAVGYDRDLDLVRAGTGPTAIPVPLPAVQDAWRQVGVDLDGAILVPEGVALDLGATGKAFASDLIAQEVSAQVGTDLIISVGGDVAVGVVDEDAAPHPWQIAIAELPDTDAEQTVILERGGLATSGVLNRRWKQGGQTVHHLLDPRTGRPVERSWRTVSVAAASCTMANTASTAAIVLGEQAAQWLTDRQLPARLVSTQGQVLRLSGWPEEGE